MAINLHGQSFLTLKDLNPEAIYYLLNLSRDLKQQKRSGIKNNLLAGKNIVLLFDKHSTRTRCAFEVAAYDEGAHVTFLTNSHMGEKESIEDTAKVLGRFYDGIEYRGFKQSTLALLATHAGIPVWNGLTDEYHPTQILADCLTIMEKFNKPLSKIKLVFVGDAANNIGNSWMMGAAKLGMHFVALAPASLFPDEKLIASMQTLAKKNNATIEILDNIDQALYHADVVYSDVWASMGEEQQLAKRIELLRPYQVNRAMLAKTQNPNVIFMHCLPACHDNNTKLGQMVEDKYGLHEMEVTDEVFRSANCVAFDQAENRLHTIKAVMVATIGNV